MIITLTTDIGWEYAGEMKGKILSINPSAKIVDISHEVMPQNIMQGAFILYSVAPHFKKAIHIGVVDPGVGTSRKAIIIKCGENYFIGPDNGMLIPAAKEIGIEKVYEIKVGKNASPVFHGRDVFAPAAGKISSGIKPEKIAKEIKDYVDLSFGKAILKEGMISGKILFIDRFGNIITNVCERDLRRKKFFVRIGKIEREIKIYPSYGYAEEREIIGVIGSSGFLEVAMNKGNASQYFKAKEGERLEIFF
ncbi:MAG TPA: hypothetical protein ENI33_06055 [Thermoplasmatales archaeon]|nr:hypothetical protein [Thermoplasmatales archaeon]